MIKNIAFAIAFIIITKILVFLFIENKQEPKINQKELESIALALNKNYPKTSPNGIRIDRLSTGIGLITYHKTLINYSVADFDANSLNSDASRQELVDEACSNSGTKKFLKSGISIQNIYRDKNGTIVSDRTVRPKDCI
ncbi:hypothetical protein E0E50_03745 [Azotobacter chroococcum subsp. isscasi]|uniref:hypothetical protein n=1 Tax=Azotobacter chroococcum TaxID=353 RepID=UPI00103FA5D2|nr:hypothetical protein [Azotobacter chroococcum]TBW12355.1 hypothetical protein E0E50_03745 [Azotobacter chroococcum subsp. isscasi]